MRLINRFRNTPYHPFASGEDEDVVRQDESLYPWDASHDDDDPWPHDESHIHHGERAPLRDAATPHVWGAHPSGEAVVHFQVLYVRLVGLQDARWHTRRLRHFVDYFPPNLAEEFHDVSNGPCKLILVQFMLFDGRELLRIRTAARPKSVANNLGSRVG